MINLTKNDLEYLTGQECIKKNVIWYDRPVRYTSWLYGVEFKVELVDYTCDRELWNITIASENLSKSQTVYRYEARF